MDIVPMAIDALQANNDQYKGRQKHLQQDDVALADVSIVNFTLQQPEVNVPDQPGLSQRATQKEPSQCTVHVAVGR